MVFFQQSIINNKTVSEYFLINNNRLINSHSIIKFQT